MYYGRENYIGKNSSSSRKIRPESDIKNSYEIKS